MTKTVSSALAASTALVAIVGILFGDQITSPVWKAGEWARIVVTAIALLISAYIIWKNRSEVALKDSIDALKTAVEAHKIESAALTLSITRVTEEKSKLEQECLQLRAKTDVGQVLQMLTLLTTSTNEQLKTNQEILREVHQKIMGWNVDRRDSLRRDERGSGTKRRSSQEDDPRTFDKT